MAEWRMRRLLVVILLLAGLSGCASVPDNGPAVPVALPQVGQSTSAADSGVNAILQQPQADPEDSANAYLNALQTTHNPGRLGDVFLSSAIRAQFDQNPSIVVVQQVVPPSMSAIVGDTTIAQFAGVLVGTVDAAGTYHAASGGAWQMSVRMIRQGGFWLFADPPPLLVTEDQFSTILSPTTVYFAATASTVTGANPKLVVPEQRYLNLDAVSSMPTQVVDFLLGGPSEVLSRVAHNPLPGVKRNSRVQFDNGDLVIELQADAESVSAESLDAFVAEVGWSLGSLISGRVRLLVGGRPLHVAGFNASQAQSSWRAYNPASVGGFLPRYYLKGGAVQRVANPQTDKMPGPRLDSPAANKRVHSAATSLDGRRLATVQDNPSGGVRLWVADASGTLQPTLRAASIGRPTWGGNSSTVVVPVGGRLLELGVGNANQPIEVEVFAGGGKRLLGITAVRLSADGLRALLIAGTGTNAKLYVGTLTGASKAGGSLVLNVQLLAVPGTPKDVSWLGPVSAAVVMTSSRNAVLATVLPVDGSPGRTPRTVANTATDPIQITADPSYPAQTGVWVEVGGQTYQLTTASSTATRGDPIAEQEPFYPG